MSKLQSPIHVPCDSPFLAASWVLGVLVPQDPGTLSFPCLLGLSCQLHWL